MKKEKFVEAYIISSVDSPALIITDAPKGVVYEARTQDAEDDEEYVFLIVAEIQDKGYHCEQFWAEVI